MSDPRSEPEESRTLDYHTPREARLSDAEFARQCVSFMLVSLLAAPFIVLGGGAVAGSLVMDLTANGVASVATTYLVGGAFLFGLISLAIHLSRRPRWRGYGLGMFIGLGVDLLLFGLCFAMQMR